MFKLKKGMANLLVLFTTLTILCKCYAIIGPAEDVNPQIRSRETANCPHNCYCSSYTVTCDNWSQSPQYVIIPRDTRILNFQGWPVEKINSTFIRQIQNVRWLRLSGGNLLDFPIMDTLDHLTYLDLSDNSLSSLPPNVFISANPISHLNVSGNLIRDVSSKFLFELNQLRVLDISRNPFIIQIPPNFFKMTPNLRYIDLSKSNATHFYQEWSENLQNLFYFNISHNKISIIPPIHMENLQIFDLSFNPLLYLPALDGLRGLKELYVTHSNISYLSLIEMKGCNQLEFIDISFSNLTNLNENILGQCKNLVSINLSYNLNLWRVEHGAFSDLSKLKILKLNNCPKLYDLEEDSFNGLINLRELHLEESGVKFLPFSLSKLHNLSYVNLEGTTLLCNCYAHWLPLLLNTTDYSLWKGINPIQCQDGINRSLDDLNVHLISQDCNGVYTYSPQNQWTLAPWGQNAILECNITGNPPPKIIWLTADHRLIIYNKSMDDNPWLNHEIAQALSIAEDEHDGKYQVLESGELLVRDVNREDIGRYKCFAYNPVSNVSVITFLGLQDERFRAFILESFLFGLFCAAVFLIINLIIQFIKFMMDRFGCECCCCKDRLSPKAKQIRKLIESVESYKTAQLEKLRENYTSQVVSIKDSCYFQMERVRDSYAQQSKNLKDLRDYSTQQISGARDQYIEQVNKIRDYSTNQMNRVRENYVFQRHRIRKFSGHQLLRLRETYKYQQKTLNKLLETLPDLYIQNCRTGLCQRTDSIIFENEIDGLDIYYKMDFLDNRSNSSDYYTPTSTLTRQTKKQNHSRTASCTSGGTEYQETCSSILRQGSTRSEKLAHQLRFHNRSFSLATEPIQIHQALIKEVQKQMKGHKRSISVSHTTQSCLKESNSPPVPENGLTEENTTKPLANNNHCSNLSKSDSAISPTNEVPISFQNPSLVNQKSCDSEPKCKNEK